MNTLQSSVETLASRQELTEAFLVEKYVNEKLSAREISSLTGWSYIWVQTRIKKFNIPRRPKYLDLRGRVFDKLKVIEIHHLEERTGMPFWTCRCECGMDKVVPTRLLRNKRNTKSCGCSWKTGYNGISARHFSNIRSHATTRDLEIDISIQQIWDLYLRQNKKCAISGVLLKLESSRKKETTASLDRIDSSKGYVMDNVQWVHKTVNIMKSNLLEQDFIEWAKTIYLFNRKKSSL